MDAGHTLCMSMAQALLLPGTMAFLVVLLMLGSWLEVRMVRAERQVKLLPVDVRKPRPGTASGSDDAHRSA